MNGGFHHLLSELNLALPFWRYLPLCSQDRHACLFDSGMDPRKLGRYSFLGSEPFLVFEAKRRPGEPPDAGADIKITRLRDDNGELLPTPRQEQHIADPFTELRRTLEPYHVPRRDYQDSAAPFLGGAVGYFGFEAAHCIERLPETGADDLGLPDITFLLLDAVLIHCHESDRSWLSVCGRGPDDDVACKRAHRRAGHWLERIAAFETDPPPAWTGPVAGADPAAGDAQGDLPLTAHFTRETYCRAVQRIKDHILDGDVFEVCLTHRLEAPQTADPWDLYQELRRINPAPFAAYLQLPAARVVCASPERFLRLGPDAIAESRPIKGTRPRGRDAAEDERLKRELEASEKDRAENLMIVDLVRNDLGRVCKYGTVTVPELQIVESYATVFQMVSTIRGELADDCDGLDLVRACFPGGSMTGAPKIEALKIIDGLEPVRRGIYAGAIGYLDYAGTLDLNIVIRSIICREGRCYFNVGGAVVADSDPEAEYQETLDKARALIAALRNVQV